MMKVEEIQFMSCKITARAEDYLRTIHKIIEQQGFAKTGDIALGLNVKPASVVEMLNKLQKLNLIIHKKYGEVKLTRKGLSIAEAIKKRHNTFREFLKIILVSHEVAVKDAHILEHKLDHKTILQFAKFVDFMTLERPGLIKRWKDSFKCYCDKEDKLKQVE